VKAACREHELIRMKETQILELKKLADTALHRGETTGLDDMAMERQIVRFMELLAVLIQCAPDNPTNLPP
jgi:hypothetical protein